MASKLRACKACKFLSDEDSCPRCGTETTREWQGYLAVTDYTRSEIAERMDIKANGRYALKVRV